MKKIYKAANGARFNDEVAQIYGEYLEDVLAELGGIDPRWLVDNRQDSPIDFEEDESKAAYEYRVLQAYDVLRHILVEVKLPDGGRDTVRAFHPIRITVLKERSNEEPTKTVKVRVYKEIDEILSDESMRSQLFEQALSEFRYMRKKYAHIKELTSIFDAIDKAN